MFSFARGVLKQAFRGYSLRVESGVRRYRSERSGLLREVSDDTRQQIRALPHIDKRFARYSLEELATRHSYFLLRPEPGSLRGEAAAGAMQAP